MKKKLSIIGIALMLAFYPTFAFAAETSQNEAKAQEKNELSDDANVSVEKADVDKQADQDDASTDKEESVEEEVDSVDSNEGSKEENADTDSKKRKLKQLLKTKRLIHPTTMIKQITTKKMQNNKMKNP